MKKLFALLLAVIMVMSMATIVSAETTTLTTEVPPASYTLNVPVEYEVDFGATITRIGRISVTDSNNFAAGKNLKVTITYDDFKAENISTTIPFTLECPYGPQEYYTENISSGSSIVFKGNQTGKVDEFAYASSPQGTESSLGDLKVIIDSKDWGKALAGAYTAVITYTCEVVVE